MTWAKLDDGSHAHPKFLGLNPAAIGLWCMGLSYCASQLDGLILSAQVPRLVATSPARARRLACALVKVGLWDEDPNGFRMHDYLDYNPSREEVLRERAKIYTRVRRYRARRRMGR